MKKFYSITSLLMTILCGQHVQAQCDGSFPPFSLGNDTTICQGSSLPLTPGPGFATYLWDNNSTNATRYVSQAGTYSVTVGVIGDNIITNGDFESGNSGFTTSYVVGVSGTFGPLSNAGTYAITTSPKLVHDNFSVCQDHTPDPGTQMMVVNGAGTPNTNVWCQSVAVEPNTDYQFSTWVSSALNDANVAQLQFSINSSSIGNVFSPTSTGCNWQRFFQTWNAGINTTAQICVVNQNTNTGGNDFMLDDISFAPICYATDQITVTATPVPVITVSPNVNICAGEQATLTASSTTSNLTYVWTPGNLTGQSINVSPTASTVYSVIGSTSGGCLSNIISTSVLVKVSPVLTITGTEDSLCKGEELTLTGASNITGTTFSWSPVAGTGTSITDVPLATKVYTLTGTSPNGCVATKTYEVVVIPDITVNITGNPTICDGFSTTLYANSNTPGTDYEWEYQWGPIGSPEDSVVVNGATGWYYLTGSYLGCSANTDSLQVLANVNPTIVVPEDFIVCPGEAVTATVSSNVPNSNFTWMPGNLSGATNTLNSQSSMTYYVYAESQGCVSPLDSFTVSMSAACFLEIPNVFTPNGDSYNDEFRLVNFSGIKSLECQIFNRWGNVVTSFDTPDFAWDGKDSGGNETTEGTYFYQIKAVTSANEELENTGFVQLIRGK